MKQILSITAALCVATLAQATTFVWDGGAVNNSFFDNNVNWENNLAPVSSLSSDFTFAGSNRTDVLISTPYAMNQLKFSKNSSSFTLFGMPLTIGAGGINNRSNNNQTIQSNVSIAADQIWNVEKPNGRLETFGYISGDHGIEKTGPGTLVLSNVNNYSGPTTISAGTLQLGTDSALPNQSMLVLNGGTLDMNGYSDFAGSLTLTADSTINFGSSVGGDYSMLVFQDSSANTWTAGANLYITSWNGNGAGNGYDQLITTGGAAGLNASQLAQIKFVDPQGWDAGTYDAMILATGEIVPVPEPATIALGSALLGLVGADARRRRQLKAQEEDEA